MKRILALVFVVAVAFVACEGDVGPMGPAGTQGSQGEIGTQGPGGSEGSQGEIGPEGPQGDSGADGQNGDNGEDGATGSQGPQGDAGDDGATGSQGPQGEVGPEGPSGGAIRTTYLYVDISTGLPAPLPSTPDPWFFEAPVIEADNTPNVSILVSADNSFYSEIGYPPDWSPGDGFSGPTAYIVPGGINLVACGGLYIMIVVIK